MKPFLTHLAISFKVDIRDKGVLIDFYILPIVFYLVMCSVFVKINPASKHTLIASLICFGVCAGALLGVSSPLAAMRENGILRSYRVLGINSVSILITKALSTFFHMLISSTIILLSAPLIFKVDAPHNYLSFFGVLALLILSITGIGMLIGAAVKSHMANMLAIMVFLLCVMLGGMMFPSSILPGPMAAIGKALPVTYAMQAFNKYSFGQPSSIDPILCIFALLGFIIVCFAACAARFIAVNRESV